VSGGTAPTGTVSLSYNGLPLASGIALSGGSWTYVLNYSPLTGVLPLDVGPNTIIAAYSGDSTHAVSSSTPLRLSILKDSTAPDFFLAPSVNYLNVTSSAPSGSFSLLFSSQNGFAGTITPSYSAPAGITCSLSPTTVNLAAGANTFLTATCSESGLAAGNYPVAFYATATYATGPSPNTTTTLKHSAQIVVGVH
jgi:hypothetical protein